METPGDSNERTGAGRPLAGPANDEPRTGDGARGANEGLDQFDVLDPGRGLDAGGDVDAVCLGEPQRLGVDPLAHERVLVRVDLNVPVDGGKVSLIAGVTADATSRVKAGDLVNHVAQQVGGKGGGRADMAQAGGTLPDQLPAALASVSGWVAARAG